MPALILTSSELDLLVWLCWARCAGASASSPHLNQAGAALHRIKASLLIAFGQMGKIDCIYDMHPRGKYG